MDSLYHDILNVKMSNFMWFSIVDLDPVLSSPFWSSLGVILDATGGRELIAQDSTQYIVLLYESNAWLGIKIYLYAALMAFSCL